MSYNLVKISSTNACIGDKYTRYLLTIVKI